MKKFLVALMTAALAFGIIASTATAARTLDGRTYDAQDPYCYYNAQGEPRIYTGATVTGTTNYIHVYDKRLMVSADYGATWHQQSILQSWQAPSGTVNQTFWSGPPSLHIGLNEYLYITQVAVRYLGQPVNWANADRSAGKYIYCP